MSEVSNKTPINSHCPWSGKAVSQDSITQYKQVWVGFCNPGCRDQFETACKHFDELLNRSAETDCIDVINHLPARQAPIDSRYLPRHFKFNAWWDIAGIHFKVYTIHGEEQGGVGDDLLCLAENYVSTHLPGALLEENPHHGSGFIIVHRGVVADWLLIHWWSDQDICLHMLAYQNAGSSGFVSAHHRRFHACIWEQVVINHEKDAWVRMLSSSKPDIETYWQDVMTDGSY